ncbi:MAG: hypothetical protein LBM70_05080 [Victivallales bacterium]|jgi:SSS family solute:Na+ symporter|nr:hypothetical protein [Victivallales bacterium]
MNLHWIDWCIVILVLCVLIGITFFTKRYNRSVSDFLAANRLAGRYLLTVSAGFGGAISLVATWEMMYQNGLPVQWWKMMTTPLGLIIALTGFVIYRFRETRALTMAQFFEMRYSRKFRFFSGFLCWTSGILNYGIFPAVTARFIIYFFGLPHSFMLWGFNISTFPLVMIAYMGIAVYIACAGGQISIMLTDFFQGMLLLIIFLVIMFYLLTTFGWSDIIDGLKITPINQSLINPFETSQSENFNVWYFLIGMMGTLYGVRAWQGNSGYNSAAKTPHEAVMAGIVGTWRTFASELCIVLIPVCAYAAFHSDKFAVAMAPAKEKLAEIADPVIQTQMTVPLFLVNWLPIGIFGLFAVVVIACAISNDDTYIHAWGCILIQDVIMPLRKKPFEPKTHMFILRCGIVGVAIFGFIFSMLFPLKDFILMYFSITGAIYLGGAGAVIIGGLYWKRGSAPAAWTAMLTGTVIGFGGIILQLSWVSAVAPYLHKIFPHFNWLTANMNKFPINGQYIYFITMLAAIVSYIGVSLLGPKHCHNMDKLLHRGEYADKNVMPLKNRDRFSFSKLIGISSNFTCFDRFIAYATAAWSLGWWGIFLIVSTLALTIGLTTDFWIEFWWWKLIPFSILLGTVCTVWITIGGIRDALQLIKDLRAERIDNKDDGFVQAEETKAE